MATQEEALGRLAQLRVDFPVYAETCLKIRTKDERIDPFEFNEAQRLVHARLEEQLRTTGKVRALILKGRQQGVSTYVEGRYYHKASLNKAKNVYILTHEDTASKALFSMVDRYHRHNPLRPSTGNSNVRELEFDLLDSSYAVATAGSKAGGRGKTISLFHGSEVAFWPNAKEHFASSVQTVPDMPGTEIILESTANGPSGVFYDKWQEAIAGVGDYIAIFISWLMQSEYSRPVPPDFELEKEPTRGAMFSEVEYMKLYGAALEQMVWRRNKIIELGSAVTFDVEYPADASVAFQQTAEGAYHDAADVLRARKRRGIEPIGPLVMGIDPAGEGGDRFAVAYRRGYSCYKIEWKDKIKHDDAVVWVRSLIDEHDPAIVFIDAGGIGRAIITSLRALGERYNIQRVKAVNFGAKSQAKTARPNLPGPKNRRAEMQQRVKEWLQLAEGVSIPDMDVLQADLVETKIKKNMTNDLQLEEKEDIRQRGARSPDLADALGLTFADTFYIERWTELPKEQKFERIDAPGVGDNDGYWEQHFEGGGGDNGWMG